MPYLAIVSFAAPNNRVVGVGQEVEDDDPVVKGREALFAKIDKPLPKGPSSYSADDDEKKPAPRRRAAPKKPAAEGGDDA